MRRIATVSYTHLDVYKRQLQRHAAAVAGFPQFPGDLLPIDITVKRQVMQIPHPVIVMQMEGGQTMAVPFQKRLLLAPAVMVAAVVTVSHPWGIKGLQHRPEMGRMAEIFKRQGCLLYTSGRRSRSAQCPPFVFPHGGLYSAGRIHGRVAGAAAADSGRR